jgi:predicted dehydrogenase
MNAKVAVVGLGYWGPNLLRCLHQLNVVAAAFELNEDLLRKFATNPAYSGIFFDTDWEKCLGRIDINAVVIATPPQTHFGLAMKALVANKHVFIEKPMVTRVEDAEEIIKLAKERDRIVMVGHTFLYTPEVRKIKEIIDGGELGNIQYIHASRLNLGKFQKENVVSDLSPHDISIFNYLLDDVPQRVHAQGYSFIRDDVVEVAFVTFEYTDTVCNLHLSWLDPMKKRTTTICGTKKMLVYDMLAEEKIKIYDKGVDYDENANTGYGQYLLSYRHGDIYSPATDIWEPLSLECKHFIECVKNNEQPLTDGEGGLEVVKAVVAALVSLETGEWVWV